MLTLSGMALRKPAEAGKREAWRTDRLPCPPSDWSWVDACRHRFADWTNDTAAFIEAVKAAGDDASKAADVLDWSFQAALDEVAAEHLGTKWVGPRAVPVLDAAGRLAQSHHRLCQDLMHASMRDPAASDQDRREARQDFLQSSRRMLAANARRKRLDELRLFRDVEAKQADSKLFWSRFKAVRNSVFTSKSPPPVAVDGDGNTVTSPLKVLAAWREFCSKIAAADLTGTKEEGIYDEEYKLEVEARLAWLRQVRRHQPGLDKPITREEVFGAIRDLRVGSAPGEDGLLPSVLKHAADAVNNGKLRSDRGHNSVVTGLTMVFNFMFDQGVWPERWGSGVIVPIHKHDSRLDPSNYRPITLLSVLGKLFGRVINTRLSNFSEATDSVCDEQGGFRRKRGTPDQIFLLREILASRKERGLATYATYIDVRKAYDTVWREQAYVRIHDSGVRGKLWRQLQAMHQGLSRRVRHPLGLTDAFGVERGVAQGAVESPWVYSAFIDPLARALKAAGLGVWIGGVQVPLLMYADDMVMLARSQEELHRMNAVVSAFAKRNRFQFNGDKSAVMAFNATPAARKRCAEQAWSLSGETVEVKSSYVYLGTVVPADGLDWDQHVRTAIEKARRRSADLLWALRADRGMRPRTAVTLWQSLVRPLLEYASELWSGSISEANAKAAERVQMTFLRGTLGLHANGSGAANEVVRAEAGVERLQDRWAKLKLGYWRRIHSAPPGRLLRVVAEFRHGELQAGGRAYGTLGWMAPMRACFAAVGLLALWHAPAAARMSWAAWRRRTYDAVDTASDAARAARMAGMSSASTYIGVKAWGPNPEEYSFSTGEQERLGQHVPERYLDDRVDLKGTRLKVLCRLGCLPLMDRVGREARGGRWPKAACVCPGCGLGQVETTSHFVLDCPAYAVHRARLFTEAQRAIASAPGQGTTSFADRPPGSQLALLLGQRIDAPRAENRLDRAFKRFLRKAWNIRAPITAEVNKLMGTNYEVFSAPAG